MHVHRVTAKEFRRFSDLTVELLGQPQLVVLCGPNGSGKSSLFDAIKVWYDTRHSQQGWQSDDRYYSKKGSKTASEALQGLEVTFHESTDGVEPKKFIYSRSAYRNDPDFQVSSIQRAASVYEGPRFHRMIDNDARVTDNYQRMISQGVDDVWSGKHDGQPVETLRESRIGQLRDAFNGVFPNLALEGLGDPLSGGTFLFCKGTSRGFSYKNLSGGEKSVFDLLLDLRVKSEMYDHTVFCIDEPEAHSNPQVQGAVLDALLTFLPSNCQLWVATHSIGMLRRARELQEANAGSVAFLDFQGHEFDGPVILRPVAVTRDFWKRTLEVALGDIASLVAPSRVVLCEGNPRLGNKAKGQFDARCYSAIFGDHLPDTDFVSVGNSDDVADDTLKLGSSMKALVDGTAVSRVIDRDQLSAQEIADLGARGVRVLSRRHIESFLLDDTVLTALCASVGKADKTADVLAAKQTASASAVAAGRDADDDKATSGDVQVACKRILGLTGAGNTKEAFMADTLAPLIEPGMTVYAELHRDLFE